MLKFIIYCWALSKNEERKYRLNKFWPTDNKETDMFNVQRSVSFFFWLPSSCFINLKNSGKDEQDEPIQALSSRHKTKGNKQQQTNEQTREKLD